MSKIVHILLEDRVGYPITIIQVLKRVRVRLQKISNGSVIEYMIFFFGKL